VNGLRSNGTVGRGMGLKTFSPCFKEHVLLLRACFSTTLMIVSMHTVFFRFYLGHNEIYTPERFSNRF
jgi:hypothetical protein